MSLALLSSGFEMAAEATRVFAAAAVSGLWQGVVLAGAAAVGLRVVPRTSATVRFFVWIAVLVGAAGLPFVHLARGGAAVGGHALRLGMGWSLAIGGVWAVVSVWRLAVLAGQGIRLRRIWREARPIGADREIAAVLGSLALRRVELCVSDADEVDRPSVIGFFAPRILIPGWLLEQLTAAELRQIVLHEVEHLRRGDDWLNLLQKLSLAVFPLNPVLVWVERRLCSERELACDDGVLRVTASPTAYASCLTALAERGLARRMGSSLVLGALGSLGSWGSLGRRSELSRRVYGILYRQPVLSPARSRAIAAVLVVGLAGAGAELARSPELVSFAGPSASGLAEMQAVGGDRVLGVDARAKGLRGFEDVVFSGGSGRVSAAPRMSLLKATLPGGPMVSGDAVPVRASGGASGSTLIEKKTGGARAARVERGAALVRVRASVGDGRETADRALVGRALVAEGIAGPLVGEMGDGAAAEGDGWVVLTSFAWSEDGRSATVVRSAQFVRRDGRSGVDAAVAGGAAGSDRVAADGIVFRGTGDGLAAPTSGLNGASTPKTARPRQVLIRYAAVPTDLGWLIVQL